MARKPGMKPIEALFHVFTLVPERFGVGQRRRRDRREPCSRESRLSGECSFGVHGDYHYRLFAWHHPPHPWWLYYRLGDRRCWQWLVF